MSSPICAVCTLRLARAGLWVVVVTILIAAQMTMHSHHGTDVLHIEAHPVDAHLVDAHPVADAGLAAVAQHAGWDHGTDDDHGSGGHVDAFQRWVTAISSGLHDVIAAGLALLAAVVPAVAGTMGELALLAADRYAWGAPRGPTLAGVDLLLSISMLRI